MLDLQLVLIVLLGGVVGGGVVLLYVGLVKREPSSVAEPGRDIAGLLRRLGGRVPLAVVAGLLVLLLTTWIVAAVATGALVMFWDALFGGASAERRSIMRIEALAAWTESLRDTVAGAVGLEQAIPATAYAASPVIQGELLTMSDRLRVRVPLPVALQRFAEEMDDASADLIIAALILNSRLRGPGLREVLSSLSESARAELDMRQRVNAGRRSTRRSVQIVIGVTVGFITLLALFNPGYVAPYGTPVGQVVLLVVIGFFAAGVVWLRRLSKFETPGRFLHFRTTPDGQP
ncbi:MAG: type II secretion system protein [Nocardioidaceae bacterium]|nr:type II secretion system protein [Nocardioidaceae bacterium]NUS52947.1 type II secretion system protein [Nocardioidaceae bacterium]